ncbi:MAG: hypothetical protein AB1445_10670 [Bacillota bacterium]
MMRIRPWPGALALFVAAAFWLQLASFWPEHAWACWISPPAPQEVIQRADLFVAATVTGNRSAGIRGHPRLELVVDDVLKGQCEEARIQITVRTNYQDLRNTSVYLPPRCLPGPGTRLLVFPVERETGWTLAGEVNSIGVLENGRVANLHDGGGFAQVMDIAQDEYIDTCDCFYQEARPSPALVEPGETLTWPQRLIAWLRTRFGPR